VPDRVRRLRYIWSSGHALVLRLPSSQRQCLSNRRVLWKVLWSRSKTSFIIVPFCTWTDRPCRYFRGPIDALGRQEMNWRRLPATL